MIRLTLHRHLRDVIDEEVIAKPGRRVTNIEPWPEEAVKAAYRRIDKEWDKLEEVATRAQGKPHFDD